MRHRRPDEDQRAAAASKLKEEAAALRKEVEDARAKAAAKMEEEPLDEAELAARVEIEELKKELEQLRQPSKSPSLGPAEHFNIATPGGSSIPSPPDSSKSGVTPPQPMMACLHLVRPRGDGAWQILLGRRSSEPRKGQWHFLGEVFQNHNMMGQDTLEYFTIRAVASKARLKLPANPTTVA